MARPGLPRSCLLPAVLLLAPAALAEEGPELTPAEAARAFQRTCSPCHTVPDRSSAFDRAWLDQVNRTA